MDAKIRRRKLLKESQPSSAGFPHQARPHYFGRVSGLSWLFLLSLFYFSIISVNIVANNHLPTPKRAAFSRPDEFTEERARVHLEHFVNIGSRVAGSYQNDVLAHDYIKKTIAEAVSRSRTTKRVEVDVQQPTGSFFMPHLDEFMSVYSNITNTVVKITSPQSDENSLLLNCHTDSVSNAPGASDDAVACSVLLEILRATVADEKPLLHPLIFLFNGAEETILQASHGFITQHKWASEIKAFINLEAAGAGGQELLFQTGPSNPWLVWAWARHAPYPHGSSVGQDLFQSGIIPSDTDFRIFRDHGGKPGIDLAYIKNGYVYHTIHDKPSMIQPGCVQRAGDNIHNVVKHLVQSTQSLLPDPTEYSHGSVVYFDIFGLTMVVIPMWLNMAMNYIALLMVVVHIGEKTINPRKYGYAHFEYSSQLVKVVAVIILSYAATFLSLTIMATFMTRMNRPLSWFSHTPLAVGLYFPVTFMGMAGVHTIAKCYGMKKYDCRTLENIFFDGTLVIWSSLIFLTRNIGASHFFTIPTLFAIVGRGFFGKEFFSNTSNTPGVLRVSVYLALMAAATSLLISKLLLLGDFFVTLSGRTGSETPPDLIIALVTGICILPCVSFQICTVYLVDSMKWFYAIMISVLIFTIVLAFSGLGFPFDNDPISPSSKRFIAQHTHREFYDFDGNLEKSDSGMLICHLDYTGNTFDIGSESVMNSPIHYCKGAYCEMPISLPVLKLVRKYQYVSVLPPPETATTDLYPFKVTTKKSSVAVTNEQKSITFEVSVTGPPQMTAVVLPLVNGSLVEWSLDGNPKGRHSKASASECYYILYTGGYIHSTWDFWLKFNVDSKGSGAIFRLDVSTHYRPDGLVERVNPQSPELQQLTSELHDWVAPMTWISTYKSYMF